MNSYNTVLIILILSIFCLVLDSGVNKTLEIFGLMTNSGNINLNEYEIKEREYDGFNSLVKNIRLSEFTNTNEFNENNNNTNNKNF